MATNYEKYLAGEPLNEELAAIKAGHAPAFAIGLQPGDPPPAREDPETPLSKEERAALREIRVSAGWPILHKLLERSTIVYTKAAMVLSQDDPLGAGAELANAWLKVKLWKSLVAQLDWSVAIELEENSHEANPTLGRALARAPRRGRGRPR